MSEKSYDAREHFVWVVASMLDHPSLYMGGPSAQNKSKAEGIWRTLHNKGWKMESPLVTPTHNPEKEE